MEAEADADAIKGGEANWIGIITFCLGLGSSNVDLSKY